MFRYILNIMEEIYQNMTEVISEPGIENGLRGTFLNQCIVWIIYYEYVFKYGTICVIKNKSDSWHLFTHPEKQSKQKEQLKSHCCLGHLVSGKRICTFMSPEDIITIGKEVMVVLTLQSQGNTEILVEFLCERQQIICDVI